MTGYVPRSCINKFTPGISGSIAFFLQIYPMNTATLGIDIAKRSFDVCLLVSGQSIDKHFENSPQGFTKLMRLLQKYDVDQVHACMEATSSYGIALARYLYEQGHHVSIVNPARIAAYAESMMSRTKTDKADARIIAQFCRHQQPESWTPPPPELAQLQALVRHIEALIVDRQQHANRLEAPDVSEPIKRSITAIISVFDEQIKRLKRQINDHIDQHPHLRAQQDLLKSIPGIGSLTAAKLLGEILEFSRYPTAQKLVAYAGLSPATRQSGTSLRTRGKISKKGSAQLRKALYMPALVALRHNPIMQALKERLASRGKSGKHVVVAAMRKLLVLAYGVIKSGVPFNPNFVLDKA